MNFIDVIITFVLTLIFGVSAIPADVATSTPPAPQSVQVALVPATITATPTVTSVITSIPVVTTATTSTVATPPTAIPTNTSTPPVVIEIPVQVRVPVETISNPPIETTQVTAQPTIQPDFVAEPVFTEGEGRTFNLSFETNVETTATLRLGPTASGAWGATPLHVWDVASTTHTYSFESPHQLLYYVIEAAGAGSSPSRVGQLIPRP